ncbi:MAG: glycosyltransferase family 2 protein [Oscillospiraceae bacterium]
MDTLYIVVPCYNEEEVLPESARVLRQKLHALIGADKVTPRSRVLLVDDGSTDSTWYLISKMARENDLICGLKLSRNRGHQNALMAGLLTAAKYAEVTVSIDADLQDDVDAIEEMVDKYNAGCPIVCGVRRKRDTDTFFKRVSARGFYLAMELCGAKSIYDHADFRLMSREAVERLSCFGSEDLYIRGLITRLGLPIEKVKYDRFPRLAGESKYDLKKMLKLAKSGFQSKKMQPADFPQVGELYIEQELMS